MHPIDHSAYWDRQVLTSEPCPICGDYRAPCACMVNRIAKHLGIDEADLTPEILEATAEDLAAEEQFAEDGPCPFDGPAAWSAQGGWLKLERDEVPF